MSKVSKRLYMQLYLFPYVQLNFLVLKSAKRVILQNLVAFNSQNSVKLANVQNKVIWWSESTAKKFYYLEHILELLHPHYVPVTVRRST